MSLGRWLLVGFVVLPLAEIAVFAAVAAKIGILATLALTLLTSAVGVAVLRAAGRSAVARFRAAVGDGIVTGLELNGPGVLTILGGLLLVLPGFLTDMAGAVLLLPRVQEAFAATFRRANGPADRRRTGGDRVVDLDPDEWRREPDPDNRRRRIREDSP